jgi:hypothetical protein
VRTEHRVALEQDHARVVVRERVERLQAVDGDAHVVGPVRDVLVGQARAVEERPTRLHVLLLTVGHTGKAVDRAVLKQPVLGVVHLRLRLKRSQHATQVAGAVEADDPDA